MTSTKMKAAILAAGLMVSAAPAALADSFYLRVDSGVAMSTSQGGNIYNGSGFGHDFGNSFQIGGGAGWVHELTPVFDLRVDLTVTGYPNFSSTSTASFGAGGASSTLAGKIGIDSTLGLANAYVDWKNPSMFTPYVGAGLGVAGNNLHPITYTINGNYSGTENGSTITNFAFHGTAGVAIHVLPLWTVDLAYHYVNAGDIRSSGVVTSPGGTVTNLPALKGTLESHAFTLGLRLAI